MNTARQLSAPALLNVNSRKTPKEIRPNRWRMPNAIFLGEHSAFTRHHPPRFHSCATVSSPRLRLSLCWWGEEWQDEGLVKRASAADFVNVGGLLTEGEVSRDGRGRTVEEAVPEGAARSAEADSTVRPRPKFFPPFSDLGLTRPSPFPRGTRRASCSRAFRAACGCCISRSRASPPQSPRPSCGSSSRGNIRP